MISGKYFSEGFSLCYYGTVYQTLQVGEQYVTFSYIFWCKLLLEQAQKH